MIKFRCSYCRKLLGADDKLLGKLTTCPKCKEKTRVEPSKGPPKPGAAVKQAERLQEVDDTEEWEIVEEAEDVEVVEEAVEVELADYEEEERPRRKPRKPAEKEDEEEEERPRRRPRKPVEEEDEEERPRRKPRKPVEEEDEEEEEEEDQPRRRSRRPVDEDDEDEEEDDEDRPRRKSGRGARGRRRRDEPKPFMTRNRISGLVGVVLGVLALSWLALSLILVGEIGYLQIVAAVFGGLFLVVGVIYLIIG